MCMRTESELDRLEKLSAELMVAASDAFGKDKFGTVKWHLMRHVAAYIRRKGSLKHHSDQLSELKHRQRCRSNT